MSTNTNDSEPVGPSPFLVKLEKVTSWVLILLLIVMAGLLCLAYIPGAGHPLGLEWEVSSMILLLLASIGLVSWVALLQTR